MVTPKKEDVKPQEVPKKEAVAEPAKETSILNSPKTEEKVTVPLKKEEESVKVNVGSGCSGFN